MNFEQERLKELKREGHRLLDIYVSLNKYSYFEKPKRERSHAYEKLLKKLKDCSPHFSQMKTSEEVKNAIIKLKKMIKARKSKNDYFSKNVTAPNLKELQKNK